MDYLSGTTLVSALLIFIGSFVQTAIGFGLAVVAAPLLFILKLVIDPLLFLLETVPDVDPRCFADDTVVGTRSVCALTPVLYLFDSAGRRSAVAG